MGMRPASMAYFIGVSQGKRTRFLTPREVCPLVMTKAKFSYHVQTRSWIWAAKNNDCPYCEARAGERCLNVTDLRRVELGTLDQSKARFNKHLHHARVDYPMLFAAL